LLRSIHPNVIKSSFSQRQFFPEIKYFSEEEIRGIEMRNKERADFDEVNDLRDFFHGINTSFDKHESVVRFLFQGVFSMFRKMIFQDIIHDLC